MIGGNFADNIRDICTNVLVNEPMKKYTSFRTGGPCDVMAMPNDEAELIEIIRFCRDKHVPCFVMGNGSNLLVSDKGITGVVVRLGKVFDRHHIEGNVITVESGMLLSKLAAIALKNSKAGLAFASGIPGTIGGAVVMNAGAYGGEIADVVVETRYIDDFCNIKTITKAAHEFSYRHSIFSNKSYCILSSKIELTEGLQEEISQEMSRLNGCRREKQPLEYPSAGSAFKRPDGHFAAKLIEDAGLKGYTVGAAQVSTKHAGFVINLGNATTADVLAVMKHVEDTVMQRFGVMLIPEIKYIGVE